MASLYSCTAAARRPHRPVHTCAQAARNVRIDLREMRFEIRMWMIRYRNSNAVHIGRQVIGALRSVHYTSDAMLIESGWGAARSQRANEEIVAHLRRVRTASTRRMSPPNCMCAGAV